jgi:hypothetical protein
MDPENPLYLLNVALNYNEMKESVKARIYFEQAVEIIGSYRKEELMEKFKLSEGNIKYIMNSV